VRVRVRAGTRQAPRAGSSSRSISFSLKSSVRSSNPSGYLRTRRRRQRAAFLRHCFLADEDTTIFSTSARHTPVTCRATAARIGTYRAALLSPANPPTVQGTLSPRSAVHTRTGKHGRPAASVSANSRPPTFATHASARLCAECELQSQLTRACVDHNKRDPAYSFCMRARSARCSRCASAHTRT